MTPNSAPAVMSEPDLELDEFVAAFEAAHARHSAADLADFLPSPGHPRYLDVLTELVRIDLEFAWASGKERWVEYYRPRFPVLFRDSTRLRVVVGEEIRLRLAAGEELHEA